MLKDKKNSTYSVHPPSVKLFPHISRCLTNQSSTFNQKLESFKLLSLEQFPQFCPFVAALVFLCLRGGSSTKEFASAARLLTVFVIGASRSFQLLFFKFQIYKYLASRYLHPPLQALIAPQFPIYPYFL